MKLRLAAIVAGVALIGQPASAQQSAPAAPPFITVEGQATADVVPDTARLSLGVALERPTASAASTDVAKAAQAVVEQIAAEGIEAKNVLTTAVELSPVYPEEGTARGGSSKGVRGFRAATEILVTIRPAERASLIAAHLIEKGANTIEGVAFSSSEEPKLLDGLRSDAVRAAQRKARIYVEALGLRLGHVLEIVPSNDDASPPPPQLRMAKSMSIVAPAPAPAIPVNPGQLTLRSAVTVRFAIAD